MEVFKLIDQFLKICKDFSPVSIIVKTERNNHVGDLVRLNGPKLQIQVVNFDSNYDFVIQISDEIKVNVELPCTGIEIIEGHNENNDSEINNVTIYAFMPDGFFILNMYGYYLDDCGHQEDPDDLLKKGDLFNQLVKEAVACTVCPKMEDKKAVIGSSCGNINADIMFLAEAPGPKGADVTGIPLSGDSTGKNFDQLLESIQLKRDDVYITNAVLCCPSDLQNKVRPPSAGEINNCSPYLLRQIELVQPKMIVTLGSKALNALNQIKKHSISLTEHVAQPIKWHNHVVFPLYHTSLIVMNTGKRTKQQQHEDFKSLNLYYRNGI